MNQLIKFFPIEERKNAVRSELVEVIISNNNVIRK